MELMQCLEWPKNDCDQSVAERLVTQLNICRVLAKQLLGEDFAERMAEYSHAIKEFAAAKKISHLQAAKKLAERSSAEKFDDDIEATLILAAVVELLEQQTGHVFDASLFDVRSTRKECNAQA